MPSLDTHSLFSSLRNVSGTRKTFSFLPPHGRVLEDGEEFTVFGNVHDAICNGDRLAGRRNILAFERAVNRGELIILHTAAPIFQDLGTGDAKQITCTNGTLASADPSWESPGSVIE